MRRVEVGSKRIRERNRLPPKRSWWTKGGAVTVAVLGALASAAQIALVGLGYVGYVHSIKPLAENYQLQGNNKTLREENERLQTQNAAIGRNTIRAIEEADRKVSMANERVIAAEARAKSLGAEVIQREWEVHSLLQQASAAKATINGVLREAKVLQLEFVAEQGLACLDPDRSGSHVLECTARHVNAVDKLLHRLTPQERARYVTLISIALSREAPRADRIRAQLHELNQEIYAAEAHSRTDPQAGERLRDARAKRDKFLDTQEIYDLKRTSRAHAQIRTDLRMVLEPAD